MEEDISISIELDKLIEDAVGIEKTCSDNSKGDQERVGAIEFYIKRTRNLTSRAAKQIFQEAPLKQLLQKTALPPKFADVIKNAARLYNLVFEETEQKCTVCGAYVLETVEEGSGKTAGYNSYCYVCGISTTDDALVEKILELEKETEDLRNKKGNPSNYDQIKEELATYKANGMLLKQDIEKLTEEKKNLEEKLKQADTGDSKKLIAEKADLEEKLKQADTDYKNLQCSHNQKDSELKQEKRTTTDMKTRIESLEKVKGDNVYRWDIKNQPDRLLLRAGSVPQTNGLFPNVDYNPWCEVTGYMEGDAYWELCKKRSDGTYTKPFILRGKAMPTPIGQVTNISSDDTFRLEPGEEPIFLGITIVSKKIKKD